MPLLVGSFLFPPSLGARIILDPLPSAKHESDGAPSWKLPLLQSTSMSDLPYPVPFPSLLQCDKSCTCPQDDTVHRKKKIGRRKLSRLAVTEDTAAVATGESSESRATCAYETLAHRLSAAKEKPDRVAVPDRVLALIGTYVSRLTISLRSLAARARRSRIVKK